MVFSVDLNEKKNPADLQNKRKELFLLQREANLLEREEARTYRGEGNRI